MMHTPAQHLSTLELENGLGEVLDSPSDHGRLETIFVRPASNERRELKTARLTPEGGIDGDRWVNDSYYRKNGQSDPRCQVSLMNARFLLQIAGDAESRCLAGDNLIVDLDLSEVNLPAGTQLAIGGNVIVELTDLPHTGCSKFQSRYGKEAREFANNDRGKSLHLRGRYARVVTGGTIKPGDTISKRQPTQ